MEWAANRDGRPKKWNAGLDWFATGRPPANQGRPFLPLPFSFCSFCSFRFFGLVSFVSLLPSSTVDLVQLSVKSTSPRLLGFYRVVFFVLPGFYRVLDDDETISSPNERLGLKIYWVFTEFFFPI